MTAFMSFRFPDCVRVLSDAAVLDADGSVIGLTSKVIRSPHMPMIVTGCGDLPTFTKTVASLGFDQWAGSFDDFIIHAQDVLRTQPAAMVGLLVAGISETAGPSHYFACLHKHYDVPPFIFHPMPEQAGAGPEISLADVTSDALTIEDVLNPDFPLQYGAAIMTAMRRTPATVLGSSAEHYIVGGACELTTVERTGVSMVPIIEWDDIMGEPINPFRASATDMATA